MENKNFKVQINEPCHEDWNKMLPDEKGKFCLSCNKTVVDFSNKTDEEIKYILIEKSKEKVCGRFKNEQLNRPLESKLDLNKIPYNTSLTKRFAIALFLVFGSFLFSCKDYRNEKVEVMGEIEPSISHPLGLAKVLNDTITHTDSIICDETIFSKGEIMGDVAYEMPIIADTLTLENSDKLTGDVCIMPTEEKISKEPCKATMALQADSSIEVENLAKIGIDKNLKNSDSKNFNVYPNPSNRNFTIQYEVTKPTRLTISVFDLNGALINQLANGTLHQTGKYELNCKMEEFINGVYFVSITGGGYFETKKIVLAN